MAGEGPGDARIVIVGEQPGDEEDLGGRPFIGPAGRLLDELLREAGIDRRATYVTNAVKHGNATEVNIGAKVAADGLTMTVEDNGIGFKRTKSSGGGMGMHIMRYRARAMGGELTALSRPGGGAVVSCFCPFPSPPPLGPKTYDAAE